MGCFFSKKIWKMQGFGGGGAQFETGYGPGPGGGGADSCRNVENVRVCVRVCWRGAIRNGGGGGAAFSEMLEMQGFVWGGGGRSGTGHAIRNG